MISDDTLQRLLPARHVALMGDLLRACVWAALAVVWASVILPYTIHGISRLSTEGSNDFTIFYYSARRVAAGVPLYGPLSPAEVAGWPYTTLANLNPPHVLLFIGPLARLTYVRAAAVWALVSVLSVAVSWTLIARELRLARAPRLMFIIGTALLASAPYLSAIVASEIALLLVTPFTLAWLAARRGHWTRAGGWLGLCVALKPFLGLFLVWLLVTRRWRALASAAGAASLCIAAGLLAFGWHAYMEWLSAVGQVVWWWPPENASLRGLTDRLFVAGHGLEPLLRAPGIAAGVAGALSLTVGIVTLARLPLGGNSAESIDSRMMLLFCASLLISPLGWIYYLPLCTGAVLGIVTAAQVRHRRGRAAFVCGTVLLFVPLAASEAGQPSGVATLLLASCYSWALICWWIALAQISGSAEAVVPCRGR
jgi:alpha-1,2-mannosyltransferase